MEEIETKTIPHQLQREDQWSDNASKLAFLRQQFFENSMKNVDFTQNMFEQIAALANLPLTLVQKYYKTYRMIESAVFKDFDFMPDAISYLNENRHPTIQELIGMSEHFNIPYKSLVRRFQDYRFLRNEQCSEGDTCQKVQAYLKKTWKFNRVLNYTTRKQLEAEFENAKTVSKGNKIYIGYMHMIMEKTDLDPAVIEEEFWKWKNKNVVVRESITSALLLEIDVTNTPTWEDVEEWARKYRIDTEYVYKTVLDQKNLMFLENEEEITNGSNFITDEELEKLLVDEEVDVEVKEQSDALNSTEIKISKELPFEEEVVICEENNTQQKIPAQQYPWEDNLFEITQHFSKSATDITVRDVLNISHKLGLDAVSALKTYQFRAGLAVESLEAFENNLHPTIQEMIEISEKSNLDYADVFRKFETLRQLKKAQCEPGDICQKVRSFFIYNDLNNRGKIDTDVLYPEFEWLEANGKKLTLGYQHLIMEKTDINAKKIKDLYLQWDLMFGKVKTLLMEEIVENVAPDWDQINNWSKKYGVPVSRVCSLVDAQRLKQGLDKKEPKVENKLSPEEIVAKINEQFKVEDGKIEVPPSGSKVCTDYHHFSDDLEYFQRNPHPSIQEMIDISTKCKVPYSSVFRRFVILRAVAGEKCMPNDTCERVRNLFFTKLQPKGVLDENSSKKLNEELEKMTTFPYKLSQGYVHLLMEITNLPAATVKKEYQKWRQCNNERKTSRKHFLLRSIDDTEPKKSRHSEET